ncbi:hypothetical protein BCR44DRAFT_52251, partial [Catenaria anguillulae PL171]
MLSAYDILPAELLLGCLALARPSAHIVLSCRLASDALADGQHARLAWTHYIIFHSDLEPFYDGAAPGAYLECPEILFYPSRLAHFLRLQLPPKCTLYPYDRYEFGPLAPAVLATSKDTCHVLTPAFIDWLFCPSGPFSRLLAKDFNDLARQLESSLVPLRNIIVSSTTLAPHLETILPHVYWKPVPDLCFLLVFFIRSSQLEQLSKTLVHLCRIVPQLGQVHLPLSLWATSALDRCDEFDSFVRHTDFPDRTCSLPFFLASLALIDLAQPTLQVILAHFPQFPTTDLVDGFLSHPPLVQHFKHMLGECRDVARVTDLLAWLFANQSIQHPNSLLFPISLPGDVTLLDYTVFCALLLRFDIPHFIAPMSREERARVAGYSEQFFEEWLDRGDLTRNELLPLVLDHQLLTRRLLVLLLKSTLDNDLDSAQQLILTSLAHQGDLDELFIDALGKSTNDQCHARVLTILHDSLVAHGLDPTAALIEHASRESCFFLGDMLFPSTDGPSTHLSWDFDRIFLAWAEGTLHRDCHEPASNEHVSFVLSIADCALESPSDEYLDCLCAAFTPARLVQTLVSCVHQFALGDRFVQCTPTGGRSIGHLTALVKRKELQTHPIFTHEYLTEPELRKFKQAVAFSMSRRLPTTYSTTLDPTLDCMRY